MTYTNLTHQHAGTVANQMVFNNCHVLSVCRDNHMNGQVYWQLLIGNDRKEGFESATFGTRLELLEFAMKVAVRLKQLGKPVILGYEHGTDFRFVSVNEYIKTGRFISS